jgi:DNA polymerase (family 10)
MSENICEIFATGSLQLRDELLQRYRPSMLELLKIQGLGPKTIALLWDAYKVSTVDEVEKLAREQRIRELPRMGAKQEEKILKGIEVYRSISGRFLLDEATQLAEAIVSMLQQVPGVEAVTPAGSLRRGRETVGDLDILVTGNGLGANGRAAEVFERFLKFPGVIETVARGENKLSVKLYGGMQVDIRLLPRECYGAAMQYFTGSKQHNVSLRQRAIKMGYKLSEYGLFRSADDQRVAGATEDEVYRTLGLDCIPPELREDCGEIDAAERHVLPRLIERGDLRGDVHMHTVETDGRCTIEEMAGAALQRGYAYMAITDHSQSLAMANGLTDERALKHIDRIRTAERAVQQRAGHEFRIFAGIEVDILADGKLDLSDEVLAQMDIVIASIHSRFDLEPERMTERLLRAIENPNVCLIGHPTGRILLRRDAYKFDVEKTVDACARHRVAMEINAYPDRLDLKDTHARMCKQRGVPIIINTDSHHTKHLDLIRFGVLVARRAWLEKSDVLNTLPADQFITRLRKKPARAA